MPNTHRSAFVVAVSKSQTHTFSKSICDLITLIAGMGVEGDAHSGATVQHRSRVKADPTQPNLRQIHIIQNELLDELNEQGFRVRPGALGENITMVGVDLLALPRETLLQIGTNAVVQVTGLRNPCIQLDQYQEGLLDAVLERTKNGTLVRKAGIMGVVVEGGEVNPGDKVKVTVPSAPHQKLERV